MLLQSISSFFRWEKLTPWVFNDFSGYQRFNTTAFDTSKELVFHNFAIEKKNTLFLNLCIHNNVSVLVWIPESRLWDRDLSTGNLFDRWSQEGGAGEQNKEGKKEKEGCTAKIPARGHQPLRHVEISPRIVLHKDGNLSIYPMVPLVWGCLQGTFPLYVNCALRLGWAGSQVFREKSWGRKSEKCTMSSLC